MGDETSPTQNEVEVAAAVQVVDSRRPQHRACRLVDVGGENDRAEVWSVARDFLAESVEPCRRRAALANAVCLGQRCSETFFLAPRCAAARAYESDEAVPAAGAVRECEERKAPIRTQVIRVNRLQESDLQKCGDGIGHLRSDCQAGVFVRHSMTIRRW
ncbi:MAG: hypothetical protein HZB39_10565 [Planctomycetes bacterium]|nr:hypothetical protein [Planctomycetota bacterium]